MITWHRAILLSAAFVALAGGLSCAPIDEQDPNRLSRGDYEVAGPNDLIPLLRLERVEGQLIIQSSAARETLSVPGVVEVGGDLVLSGIGAPGAPLRVELPDLVSIGGRIRLTETGYPLILYAPRLRRVGGIRVSQGSFVFELDNLTEVQGNIDIRDAAVQSIRFPQLRRIGGGFTLRRVQPLTGNMIPVELPELSDLGGRLDLRDTSELTVVAPRLETMGDDLRLDSVPATLQLDSLRDVDGDLMIQESTFDVRAPLLERVRGRLTVDESFFAGPVNSGQRKSWVLPNLVSVERAIGVRRVLTLEGFELPALTSVGGEIRVREIPDLEVLDISALAMIPGELRLQDLVRVELRASELTSLVGPLVIRTMDRLTADLLRLETVNQSFELDNFETDALDLRSLQDVGRSLSMARLDLAGELNLRSLRSVGVDLIFADSAGLPVLDLPNLETVGGGQGDDFGDFRVLRNFDLEVIDVQRLTEIRGALMVRDNPALDPDQVLESFDGVRTSTRSVCGNGSGPSCNDRD